MNNTKSGNKIGQQRLLKEFKSLEKNPVPNIHAYPESKNIYNWNFVIYDLDYPYKGGVYHGKLVFPSEYPMKPPKVMMLTPNGRFEVNTQICMSFTNFHVETWNPLWNIENMLIGLISFMFTSENTTGAVDTDDKTK